MSTTPAPEPAGSPPGPPGHWEPPGQGPGHWQGPGRGHSRGHWHGRGHKHDRDHPGGLAVLITLIQVLGTGFLARNHPEGVAPLGYALLAVSGLALGARRRYPVGTLVVVAAATVAYQATADYPRGPTFVALIIAGIGAVKAGRRYQAWAVAAAAYLAWVLLTGATLNRALVLLAWVAGVLLVGEWSRVAGQYQAKAAQVNQERARAHEEQQRRQASEERLRIAQELHDVLGHHLSLINVQAGVGLHLMDTRPEQARAALGTIKQASAEALREVRSVLATLHPSGEAAPRAPAPRLERLAELTADAGVPVETSVRGEPHPLPPEVDRAAYRIVQEALTNVRRHAGAGATVSVRIEYGETDLRVRVDDDGGEAGIGEEPIVEGTGIGGMRERASALGGSLTAQPRPEGGFRVDARLPLPPAEDS